MEKEEVEATIIRDKSLGKYFIEIDENQYTLKKDIVITSKETGEKSESEHVIGYYTSLLACIKKVIRLKIVDNGGTHTLEQFIQSLEKERENLEKLYVA